MNFRLLIDGALVDGAATMDVVNPATGVAFCQAPRADEGQLRAAIAAAGRAAKGWARLSFAERGKSLAALAAGIEARQDEFARLLTQEQGKPLQESRGEVAGTIATLRHYATQELHPETLRDAHGKHIVEHRRPLGVIAAILPWNYPLLLLAQKAGPALITGNAVIVKPAPTTPLTSLLVGEVAAGVFPAGVLQIISDANDLGAILSSDPGIDGVSFTGSTPTGKKVLAGAADTLKRFNLELGGNDAALVLDDAQLDVVAPRIFNGAMKNAGQVCLAIKRVYAPRAMVDPLCEALGELARQAVLGDGLNQGTTIGPVNNRVQYDKVAGLIADSRARGEIVAGGGLPEGGGFFIEPTIVRGLGDDSRLVREEQFGPVLPVLPYDDLDDAIDRINASEYGLGATVWTGDVARGAEVATRIESGTVWVNKHLDMPLDIPFGGARQSGMGRQNGIEGMKEFTQGIVVNWDD